MCLAIPARIVELFSTDDDRSALVDVVGVRRRVSLGLLEEGAAAPGDWVLIHVGFAMSLISEEDAREQMRMLEALGEASAAMEEVRGYGLDEMVSDAGVSGNEETGTPVAPSEAATTVPGIIGRST